MSRIRSIKPEFPQSETIGKLSRDARLLFIELWTVADDSGRSRAASRMLASLLFPYDDDARELISGWLAELETHGCIKRYTIDGDSYLEICNWLKHQKIDHPSASKIPPFREEFASPRETLAPDLGKDRIGKDLSSLRSDSARAKTLAPKKTKSGKTEISETQEPTAMDDIFASDSGMSFEQIRQEWAQFRDHHRKLGNRMADWRAAWRTWVRNWKKFARAGPAGRSNGMSGAIKSFLESDNDDESGRKEGSRKDVPLLPAEWRRE